MNTRSQKTFLGAFAFAGTIGVVMLLAAFGTRANAEEVLVEPQNEGAEQILCIDTTALNFEDLLPCVYAPVTLEPTVCEDDSAQNVHEVGDCVYPEEDTIPQGEGQCEFEGHKYDETGTPLMDWVIGLMKFVTYEVDETNDSFILDEEATDADGYYCLETNGYDGTYGIEGPYSFIYKIYEILEEGWENVSVEMGTLDDVENNTLTVVVEDDIEESDTDFANDGERGVQKIITVDVSEENGYIFADAAFHVDFYNQETDDGNGGEEDPELACTLTASKNPVATGEPFSLTWTTTLADTVFLTQVGETEEEDSTELVEVNGSTTIIEGITEATTYELLAVKGFVDVDEEEEWYEDFDVVECVLTINVDDSESEEDNYKIFGYVWHDKNENDVWEKEGESTEEDVAGWTVKATNGEDVRTTTTDENGRYEFNVPAGTWTITEETQSEWDQTLPNEGGYVVTVPPVPVTTFLDTLRAFVVPTAYAATISEHGPYDFGVVFKGCVTNCGSSNGGGSSSGSRKHGSKSSNNDNDDPVPQVLGEATDALPEGAPNTGFGGTAQSPLGTIVALFGMLMSLVAFRIAKNG